MIGDDGGSRYAGLPSSTVPDLAEGDSAVIWDRLSGEQRREVVRSLMSIRVDPVSHIGSNQFDPMRSSSIGNAEGPEQVAALLHRA
jgi:hypothetical protein